MNVKGMVWTRLRRLTCHVRSSTGMATIRFVGKEPLSPTADTVRTQSTTIVFEIEPGGRLGWHTDQTEETQYIVSGTGELQRDDGVFPVGPGSVFVLPTNVRHDLVNTGTETLRAVGFFSAAMFTQIFDNVMQPFNSHVLGTPNREG